VREVNVFMQVVSAGLIPKLLTGFWLDLLLWAYTKYFGPYCVSFTCGAVKAYFT